MATGITNEGAVKGHHLGNLEGINHLEVAGIVIEGAVGRVTNQAVNRIAEAVVTYQGIRLESLKVAVAILLQRDTSALQAVQRPP
jgi:hypothetical protein